MDKENIEEFSKSGFETLNNNEYLKNLINETLRLHSPGADLFPR